MKPNLFRIAVFPISGLILILITFVLIIFIDPVEANFGIVIYLPLIFLYIPFFASLTIIVYAIKLVFKGIVKYMKNMSTLIIKTRSAHEWYLGGILVLISCGIFWVGLLIHNSFLYEVMWWDGGIVPNFSYFLFTFIFIISPLISSTLLFIGNFLHNKSYKKEKEVKDDLYQNTDWLKYQHYTLKRSVQEIADELGRSMVEVQNNLMGLE